ncbi:hypothetical protein GGS21DRAFT_206098 [Xylaria nigripes]|nr:hypothetical protein GGS21DRAFT_206098 [Xylaria nigripes]
MSVRISRRSVIALIELGWLAKITLLMDWIGLAQGSQHPPPRHSPVDRGLPFVIAHYRSIRRIRTSDLKTSIIYRSRVSTSTGIHDRARR